MHFNHQGETIKIVIEDYVQHLSGFQFKLLYDPTLMHDTPIGYSNQIHSEFNLLYHWHALMPDTIRVKSDDYSLRSLLFNPKPFVDAGLSQVLTSASQQFAGKVNLVQNLKKSGCFCKGFLHSTVRESCVREQMKTTGETSVNTFC